MSHATNSIRVFALYLWVLGASLGLLPNAVLPVFGLAATHEPWVRLLGLMVVVLGLYYWRAAREQLTEFFHWTVEIRLFVLAGFVLLVALGWGPTVLLVFGALEGASAAWTWVGLRSDSMEGPLVTRDA